jgi:hypothetical protein
MAAKPVGNRDEQWSAQLKEQRLRALCDGGAQRPWPRRQAVLVVVTHRPGVAQRRNG